MAASHSTGEASGRKPTAKETPVTRTRITATWMTLAKTWPVRIEPRETDIVRKRLTMPSVMSVQTEMAVVIAPDVTAIRMMPGTT